MDKKFLDRITEADKDKCECCGKKKPISAVESIARSNEIRNVGERSRKRLRLWRYE